MNASFNQRNGNNIEDPLQRTNRFSDPVAMETGWEPVGTAGANYRTHKLKKVNPQRLQFQATIGQLIFSLIFLIVGTAFMLLVGFSEIIILLLGALFVVMGILMFISSTIPYVFDREAGLYYKSRKQSNQLLELDSPKITKLNSIHALQLLSRYVHNSKRHYYTYELNLVLQDGKRIGVLSHGSIRKLREDAQLLSEFLNKPLWDAMDQ